MCGIFGFVSARPLEATTVVEGLRYLEYRGYDSWGVAVAHEGMVVVEKAVGAIADAAVSLPASTAALGHTRWATHGGVTHANAHPHTDCGHRLALIHNGIVENHQQLRSLLRPGHTFKSQTDTEVLVHLLEERLDDEPDLLQALLHVFRHVEGLSAVAVLDAATGQVAAAKNGSPLVLGWGDEASYLASDAGAFLPYTRRVTFLSDGQAAALSPDGIRIYDVATGDLEAPDVREITWDARAADLNGHSHFMSKEIHEQPRVLRDMAERQADASALAVAIDEAADVVFIGCGTAYHAGLSGRYLLSEMAGRSAQAVLASEMTLTLPALGPDSLVIALSQSGETIDVLDAVRAARARGATIAALVNAEGSTLHREADLPILLNSGPERCVLATKSYTAKIALLQLTAAQIGGDESAGGRLREAGQRLGLMLDDTAVRGAIAGTARRIADQQHLFILGRHRNYPLALEAALKIKEVSYMHAEGFASGELKHGVIALVTYGTPCIVLAPDEDYRREILAAAAEVRARGAFVIGLSPCPEEEFDVTLPLSGGPDAAYEIAAVTQLLAYDLALIRGCDPDKPRNLAKSVTVK